MAAKQEVRSVVALGDSLTEGWNSFQSHPYTTMLQIHLNENLTHGTPPFNVENYGVPGFTMEQIAERVACQVETRKDSPVAWIVLGGSNDLGSTPTSMFSASMKEALQMIHDFISGHGGNCFVLTLPVMNPEHKTQTAQRTEYNKCIRNLCKEFGKQFHVIEFAHAFPQDADHAVLWDYDGVHLSSRGYDAMGKFIFDEIKNIVL